jgi:predicted DNA-binding transcriptional regulator AlpA
MRKRLRYADLERLGIVNNRVTLSVWIRQRGFPVGQLTGPNSRTWDEGEVQAWLDSRPTAMKPMPKPTGRRGRPRKTERETVTTT